MILLGVLLIVFGVVLIIKPEVGWFLEIGWRFRDAEPSELALWANRAGGVFSVIIGLVMIFGGFS